MRIVVTGAGGDLGRAISDTLHLFGHEPIRGDHKSCDVRDSDSLEQFVAGAWPFDGLVCCHGAPGLIKPTIEVTLGEWSEIIATDLTGTFRACQAAAKYMLSAGNGSIVNVSSIHALATYPQRAAYAAAKAGVVGLTRALAVEWAKQGVRVNAVLPGQVENTERTKRVQSEAMLARSPSGMLAHTGDVALAVLHLLENTGINGTALVVDEGWLASAWWGDHAQA